MKEKTFGLLIFITIALIIGLIWGSVFLCLLVFKLNILYTLLISLIIIPIFIVPPLVIFLIKCKSKVKEVMEDERTSIIAKTAAFYTYIIYIIIASKSGTALLFLCAFTQRVHTILWNIGLTLLYSVTGLVIIYGISYFISSKKF